MKYFMSENTTRKVDALGRVSIPKSLRDRLDIAAEDEMEFFKKGRNNFSKAHRKNINIGEYAVSSGLEAVIGYLYLSKQIDRLDYIMKEIIKIVEEE